MKSWFFGYLIFLNGKEINFHAPQIVDIEGVLNFVVQLLKYRHKKAFNFVRGIPCSEYNPT